MRNSGWPKIAVVTPNFNKGIYLERTIQSVLSQNYPNLEYFIIDGGSTDGSIEIIKKYERQLSGWITEPDKGMYDAINKGFQKTTGEVMAWINADDMYHTNSLFAVAKMFSDLPSVEWIMGCNSWYNSSDVVIKADGNPRSWKRLDFLSGNYKWIQQESVFWKRTLWEKAGAHMSGSLKFAGDLDLWTRFFKHADLYSTEVLLGGFRITGQGQLSNDHIDHYLLECETVLAAERTTLSEKENRLLKQFLRTKARLERLKNYKLVTDARMEKIIKKKYSFPPIITFNITDDKYQFIVA